MKVKTTQNCNRRGFLKACMTAASAVAVSPNLLAQAGSSPKAYARTRLVLGNGTPVTGDYLKEKTALIFHYPYVTTPCFLINLDSPIAARNNNQGENSRYRWPGGVGPGRSIVAFSAICTHKLSYPTRSTSFINYRAGEVAISGGGSQRQTRRQIIYCCSERSAYDPAKGGKVISGPAPAPLTAVILEYSPDEDQFHAVATAGEEKYDAFFEKFAFRIALENKGDNIKQLCGSESVAVPAEQYSSQQITC